MKHVALFLALLLAIAAPAAADEKDAETAYHEAYVQEVIEGNITEAAKTYLALMENEETPPRIRAESRFRFAVCAVLLGRADEGRVQLAALIADGETPPGVRAKAEEYHKSIAGLGAGSELERKLQSLVYDLGRGDPERDVPAYRDFEIIGDRAIPFLRKLLRHRDSRLRRHAFRILCRMGEDGMMKEWTLDVKISGRHFSEDFNDYLSSRPAELEELEHRLLALDDTQFEYGFLNPLQGWPAFSLDFIRALAKRLGLRSTAIDFMRNIKDPAVRFGLVQEWLAGDDTELRGAIARVVLAYRGIVEDEEALRILIGTWLSDEDPELRSLAAKKVLDHPDLLPKPLAQDFHALVAFAVKHGGMWYRGEGGGGRAGILAKIADAQSAADLHEALDTVIDAGLTVDENGEPVGRGLLTHGFADLIATSIETKPIEKIDLDRYATALKRWATVFPLAFPLDTGKQYVPTYPDMRYIARLRWLFTHADPARSTALGQWVLEETERQRKTELGDRAYGFWAVFGIQTPADVLRCKAVFTTAEDPDIREKLGGLLPARTGGVKNELKRALVVHLPDYISDLSLDAAAAQLLQVSARIDHVAPEARVDTVEAIVRAIAERPWGERKRLYWSLSGVQPVGAGQDRVAFLSDVWPTTLERLWPELPDLDREECLTILYEAWDGRTGLAGPDHPKLTAFLRAHLGEPGTSWARVARQPNLIPITEWLPIAPLEAAHGISAIQSGQVRITQADLNAAAAHLTQDPDKITPAIHAYVWRYASDDVGAEILDRLLGTDVPTLRGWILENFGKRRLLPGPLPTAKGLEAALDDLLAAEDPDLDQIRMASIALEPLKPTQRLYPAARLLLASEKRENILAGIHLAESLAQGELQTALRDLYVNTLDSRIREKAKAALRVIADLQAVRAGMKPP